MTKIIFKHKRHEKKFALFLLCAILLSLLVSWGHPSPSALEHAKAPYMSCFESISGTNAPGISHHTTSIVEDYALEIGASIDMAGWLATDEGIHHYEYAWIPTTGGVPQWQIVQNLTIISRKDLASADIPYPSGHATAGFQLTIPSDTLEADGYYDLYVRAVTGGDLTCDLVTFLHVKYGSPDTIKDGIYSVSFPRLAREEGALVNSSIEEQSLILGADGMVHLGFLDIALFENIKITYSIPKAFSTQKQAVLGFKSSNEYTYGDGEGKYNVTDNILYLPIHTQTEGDLQEVSIDLRGSEIFHSGDTYLCGYTSGEVKIHAIEMTYINQGHTRTAAKIRFAENISPYFGGFNKVELLGVNDPIMGDVLRISLTEDTNDPFATFHAEALLKEYDIRLSANDYRYMVVLARSAPHNVFEYMTFYLCAGQIMGATEDCTYSFKTQTDGKWHYYLIDLSQKDTWAGTIHNWRFDIINGDSKAGDYVDIATVQFFRTLDAAEVAAKASTTTCDTPYDITQPIVIKDMQEESLEDDMSYIIPDEDCFVVTEPETEPPAEPETNPPPSPETNPSGDTSPLPSETILSPDTDVSTTQAPNENGCASAILHIPLFSILLLSLVILCPIKYQSQKRRKHT